MDQGRQQSPVRQSPARELVYVMGVQLRRCGRTTDWPLSEQPIDIQSFQHESLQPLETLTARRSRRTLPCDHETVYTLDRRVLLHSLSKSQARQFATTHTPINATPCFTLGMAEHAAPVFRAELLSVALPAVLVDSAVDSAVVEVADADAGVVGTTVA